MTRPNITPGPWVNNADTVYMGQKSAFLAVCSPWNHPESVANARAIAAVPALLEALEAMLEAYAPYHQQTVDHRGNEDSLHSSVKKARAALTAAGYQF